MKKNYSLNKQMMAIFACFFLITLAPAYAFLIQVDNFDSQTSGSIPINNYQVFGNELTDRGISSLTSVSPPNSAYLVADFSQADFGVIMNHDFQLLRLDPSATLSLSIKSDIDFIGNSFAGLIGFQLQDGDGTVFKTQTANLYTPNTGFTTFTQNISDITLIELSGQVAGLDLQNIVHYGILFIDRNDYNGTAIFHIDNVTLTGIIPEPATNVLMGSIMIIFGLLKYVYRKSHNH